LLRGSDEKASPRPKQEASGSQINIGKFRQPGLRGIGRRNSPVNGA